MIKRKQHTKSPILFLVFLALFSSQAFSESEAGNGRGRASITATVTSLSPNYPAFIKASEDPVNYVPFDGANIVLVDQEILIGNDYSILGSTLLASMPTNLLSQYINFSHGYAVYKINQFCKILDINCAELPVISVELAKSLAHDHYQGIIDGSLSNIQLKINAQTLGESEFHELVHWVHLNTNKNDKPAWVIEAIPFLAQLMFGQAAHYATNSELMLFESTPQNTNLDDFNGTPEDYALVSLWTRHLWSHSHDKVALLKTLFNHTIDKELSFKDSIMAYSQDNDQFNSLYSSFNFAMQIAPKHQSSFSVLGSYDLSHNR